MLFRVHSLLLAAAASAVCAVAGAQVLYKSVGPDGKVSYSDRPPADDRIAKTMKFAELPNTALPSKTIAELEQLRKSGAATPIAVPTSGVSLYAAKWCGYCRQAREFLNQRGIAFQEIDVDTPSGKSAFVRAGGVGGIPLLVANGQKVRGFTSQAYESLFAGRR